MKKTLLIILTSLFISQGFSQAGNNDLAKKVETIEISNQKLQRTSDSLIKVIRNQFVIDSIAQSSLKSKITSLDDSLSITNQKIDHGGIQKSIKEAQSKINGFSSFYSAIKVLLVFFTLTFTVIPIFNWYTRIKPTLDETKELNDSFKSNFQEETKIYQDKSRLQKIDQALENITNYKNEQSLYSIHYLVLVPENFIADHHLFKIFTAVKIAPIDNEKALLQILLRTDNIYAKEYVTSRLKDNIVDETIENNCLLFLSKFNLLLDNLNIISQRLINSKDSTTTFINYNSWLSGDENTKKDILFLVNDKYLINSLIHKSTTILPLVKKDLKNDWYDSIRNKLNQSYLFNPHQQSLF